MVTAKVLKITEVQKGDTIKVKNDSHTGYGVSKGDLLKVTSKNGNNIMADGYANWFPITLFERISSSKSDLIKRKFELQKDMDAIDQKIEWMSAVGSQEFDEAEYKVWLVLQSINSKSSELEKIKAIAALIKR